MSGQSGSAAHHLSWNILWGSAVRRGGEHMPGWKLRRLRANVSATLAPFRPKPKS